MNDYRKNLGVRLNDGINYEIVGQRKRGSFRSAMREYGLSRSQIDRVIADIDCDRDVAVRIRHHVHHFAAL